jgi:penicillin-binding protein 1C
LACILKHKYLKTSVDKGLSNLQRFKRFIPAQAGMKRRFVFFMIAALIFATTLTCIRLWPRAPLSQSFASSTAIYDANGKLLRLTLSDDDKFRLWTPLKEISPTLIEATLLHEDRHFNMHPGINPFALGRGAWRTYFTDERRQGGSTITMQLARLKYRLNSRSITGKLKQIARAVQLEMSYSKKEILEAYLNLVPYGANIEGVGAGSLIYFGKRAEKLTLPEALTLTVIPQSPARRGGENSAPLVEARAALFKEWAEVHPDDAAKAAQIAAPFKLGAIDDLPFLAPHAVEGLLATARIAKAKNESATEIRSTLDLRQQRLLERHLRAYVSNNNRIGIRNASAMLLDYRTMEVKAVVGSADFFNAEIDGQVNGTLGKRSPGSTLKPFVYALGIDQGVLHPATVLRDLPSSFGPFSPENFDGQFVGPITAKDALIKSRNIPAVQVSAKLSKPSLYDFLKTAGVTRMKPEAHYGLGLVLGGGEVTMEEMVTLYASLANGGELKPIKYSTSKEKAGEKSAPGIRVMSEEAAYITLDMMKDNPRPNESAFATQRLAVHWKTGTSYGFRDAWSVGVFGPYVLAVWIGNFDGEANPVFIGATAAAPLFFQLVDGISADSRNMMDVQRGLPKRLTRIDVCTASGDLPNAACPQKSPTWFIPGVSPIRVSTIHRKIAIDNASGLQACADNANVRYETYEYWPTDTQKLFRDAGLPRRTPPAFMPQCGDSNARTENIGSPPKITSPLRGVTYALRENQHTEDSVNLRATTDADTNEVFWFADQTFIGRAKAGAGFAWRPNAAGSYLLRAVDDHGRADSRELRVTVVQ